MSLLIQAGELTGKDQQWVQQPLPFGPKARLIMIYLCSEAIRQKNPTIEIADSLSGFIRDMGFPVTGGKKGTLQVSSQTAPYDTFLFRSAARPNVAAKTNPTISRSSIQDVAESEIF